MVMAKRLKGGSEEYNIDEATKEWHGRGAVGTRLYNAFAVAGLRVDAIDPGRARFSFTVPPRLTVWTPSCYPTHDLINQCNMHVLHV